MKTFIKTGSRLIQTPRRKWFSDLIKNIKTKEIKYLNGNSYFFIKESDIFFKWDSYNGTLWINYKSVWDNFSEEFEIYDCAEKLLYFKKMWKLFFNLEPSIAIIAFKSTRMQWENNLGINYSLNLFGDY